MPKSFTVTLSDAQLELLAWHIADDNFRRTVDAKRMAEVNNTAPAPVTLLTHEDAVAALFASVLDMRVSDRKAQLVAARHRALQAADAATIAKVDALLNVK